MLDTLGSLAAFGLLVIAAGAIGRLTLRGLRITPETGLPDLIWSLASGLVIAGTALTLLGFLGLLYAPLLGVMTMALCFWGLGELWHGWLRWRAEATAAMEQVSDDPLQEEVITPPPHWLMRGLLILVIPVLLATFIQALAPPTAGDAMYYHLELPKRFLDEHRLVFFPHHEKSTFPLLVEMWFLWGLALEGGVTATLTHWLCGPLLAGSVFLLATPIIGKPWSIVAALLCLLIPGVGNQMTAPLNDLGLALLLALGLAAWQRALTEEKINWAVLAGLMFGGALATKYVALLFLVAMLPPTIMQLRRMDAQRRRQMLRYAGGLTLGILVICAGWYARAAWFRGNPVYPFFAQHIGQSAPDAMPESKTPLGANPWQIITAPWQVTMNPDRFGGHGHQLGAVFLALLPGLLLARRLRGLKELLLIAASYGLLWYLLRQNVRFLFPLIPILLVGVTWVLAELTRLPELPRRLILCCLALLLGITSLWSLYRCRDEVRVALGIESRTAYLTRSEPVYRAAQLANALLPASSHILSQDYRGYYFHPHFTREAIYEVYSSYRSGLGEPTQLADHLRQAGFTHLLLAEPVAPAADTPHLLVQLADRQLAAQQDGAEIQLTVLHDYVARDPAGAESRYRLIQLR